MKPVPFKTACLGALALVGFALTSQAVEPLDQRVTSHTLSNGIQLLILPRSFSPTVSVRMMFRAGSVDELSGQTGLAHMFEHMMFKGTQTLGTRSYAKEAPLLKEIDQVYQQLDAEKAKKDQADQGKIAALIDQSRNLEEKAANLVVENELWNLYEREGGSNLNASTSRDFTQYRVDLPANKLALWAVLDADRVKNPVFRQFYQEREVVKEERRMRIDTSPDGNLFEQFLATAYMVHPYRMPTIGWESDLDHLHIADLEDFYRRYYTPDQLTIAVVGDVKPAEVIQLAEQNFGSWKAPATLRRPIGEEPEQLGERQISVRFDAQPMLIVGYPLAAYPSRDHFVAEALAHVLSSGTSSRLYKSLVQKKKVAASIETFTDYPGNRFAPLFIFSAVPRYPHTTARVLEVLQQELQRFIKEPVADWEVEKVQSMAEMDLLTLLETNGGMADTLVYCQTVFGDWRYILQYQKDMKTVTGPEMQALAKRLFAMDHRTLATLVPVGKR